MRPHENKPHNFFLSHGWQPWNGMTGELLSTPAFTQALHFCCKCFTNLIFPVLMQLDIESARIQLLLRRAATHDSFVKTVLATSRQAQRVHVGIWYILRAQRGSHIPTLRAKYIPYSYMDPLGKQAGVACCMQASRRQLCRCRRSCNSERRELQTNSQTLCKRKHMGVSQN